VQMLDQEIAATWPAAEQKLDFMRGRRVNLAALRCRLGPLSTRAGVLELANFLYVVDHRRSTLLNLDQL
jgi:hypothetical protein